MRKIHSYLVYSYFSTSTKSQLSIQDGLRVESVEFNYKIYNNGPSTIKELHLSIQIPTIYIPKPNYHIQLIDYNEIEIQGFYINKHVDVNLLQNNKILIPSYESSSPAVVELDNLQNNGFLPSKFGMDYEFGVSNKHDENNDFINQHNTHRRRRRSMLENDDNDNIFRVFNSYDGTIHEYHPAYRIEANKDDTTLKNLPKNRTILFDCHDDEIADCVEAQFTIHNFRPGNEPISINLNFTLNLAQFGKFDNLNFFVPSANQK
jgi:hypothetical protein